MAQSGRLTRAFARALPAVVAAVFLFSCLATVTHLTHLAMPAGEECQARHASVRNCGQTVSLDMGPAVPVTSPGLAGALVPSEWLALSPGPVGLSRYQGRSPVPRSPPSLPA